VAGLYALRILDAFARPVGPSRGIFDQYEGLANRRKGFSGDRAETVVDFYERDEVDPDGIRIHRGCSVEDTTTMKRSTRPFRRVPFPIGITRTEVKTPTSGRPESVRARPSGSTGDRVAPLFQVNTGGVGARRCVDEPE